MDRVDFFGTGISNTNPDDQMDAVAALIGMDRSSYVTFSNVHVVMTATKDPSLREAVNKAAIASPDGMPLIWVARWWGWKKMAKCSGPDMMQRIISTGIPHGWRHFFYGSTPETLMAMETNLKCRFPDIQIAGMISPPFRPLAPQETEDHLQRIRETSPDCIWIGLGAPRQEIWMARHCESFPRGVLFGVGAAFDFLAGIKRRAPVWMQKCGMEWVFRLVEEPKRLFKRYAVTNTMFVFHVLRDAVARIGRKG